MAGAAAAPRHTRCPAPLALSGQRARALRSSRLKPSVAIAEAEGMKASQLALVQGMADTRVTLARWNAAPRAVLQPWLLGATVISVGLLLAVLAIASYSTPDIVFLRLRGLSTSPDLHDILAVLLRNSLVLALHAMACVAGFIAGSSLPEQAQQLTGIWRTIHEKAGPAAIAFVVGATAFSLCTQAYVLGNAASTLAYQLQIPPFLLLLTLLPHALPELVALFLPLAAWTISSRQRAWHELLAATIATVALATPVLVLAASVEVYVWPSLLKLASPLL